MKVLLVQGTNVITLNMDRRSAFEFSESALQEPTNGDLFIGFGPLPTPEVFASVPVLTKPVLMVNTGAGGPEKIKLIKRVREISGLGLTEAKAFTEQGGWNVVQHQYAYGHLKDNELRAQLAREADNIRTEAGGYEAKVVEVPI